LALFGLFGNCLLNLSDAARIWTPPMSISLNKIDLAV
jgi:hypothetical protein